MAALVTEHLPELAIDTVHRLDRLHHLAYHTWNHIRKVIRASTLLPPAPSSPDVIFFGPDCKWVVPEAARSQLDEARAAARDWCEQGTGTVRVNDEGRLSEYERHQRLLDEIVRQKPQHTTDRAKITRHVEEAFIAQLDVLCDLPAARQPREAVWLPDTNGLISRHELAKWPSSRPVILAIAPTVIQELDRLKANPRNPQVQEKARSLIAQVKEFRRRESGVIYGNLQFRKLSIWPRRWADLPGWLDRGHADDQILATALELAWTSLRSAVTLVTGDDNMQHKAELLALSYVDPEAPTRLWSPVAVAGAVLYRVCRDGIYADFHRRVGDRFLAVSGHEREIEAHLSTGAIEPVECQ